MKNSMKLIGMLLFATILLTSCSKDNDPTDDNIFIGTYKGTVSYMAPGNETNISTNDGRVTVTKVGNTYSFDFSNSIPSINGIEMEKNQNILVDAMSSITIDQGTLVIRHQENDDVWNATCTR